MLGEVSEREVILTKGGSVLKGISCSTGELSAFGEIYFSTVEVGNCKGWKRHQRMTLNLLCVSGMVEVKVVADPNNLDDALSIARYELGRPHSYKLLTVPPGVWVAFKNIGKCEAVLCNIADLEHDPEEVDLISFDLVTYGS